MTTASSAARHGLCSGERLERGGPARELAAQHIEAWIARHKHLLDARVLGNYPETRTAFSTADAAIGILAGGGCEHTSPDAEHDEAIARQIKLLGDRGGIGNDFVQATICRVGFELN